MDELDTTHEEDRIDKTTPRVEAALESPIDLPLPPALRPDHGASLKMPPLPMSRAAEGTRELSAAPSAELSAEPSAEPTSGKIAQNTGPVNGFSKPKTIRVDGLEGAQRVILSVTDAEDGNRDDLANWADGKLFLREP